jgi:hypothetical protein
VKKETKEKKKAKKGNEVKMKLENCKTRTH